MRFHLWDDERLRQTTTGLDDLSITSRKLPGGTLLAAVFDRDLMRLSDRGGASGLIGDRWADLCAQALGVHPLTLLDAQAPAPLSIERVVRLDTIPQIASTASRRKLQNPDFLLFGHRDGSLALQAADAKFSVETARSRQVSADVTAELLGIGPVIAGQVGPMPADISILDGIFLCPDYSLTHYMLRQRRGHRSVAIGGNELVLLPVTSDTFLDGLDCAQLITVLAEADALSASVSQSLLLAVYYLRLARACVACWLDQTRPLLAFKEARVVDNAEVLHIARMLLSEASGGWDLVLRWDARAEDVRRQRVAVDRVTSVPLGGPELRKQIAEAALAAGVEAPSVNRVRRRIGAWYRQEMLDAFGPLVPPVDRFPAVLEQLGRYARELRPRIPEETAEIILEMVTSAPSEVSSELEHGVRPA